MGPNVCITPSQATKFVALFQMHETSWWHELPTCIAQRNCSHAYKHNFESSGNWQSNRPLVRKNYLKAAKSSDTVVARHELEVLVTSQ